MASAKPAKVPLNLATRKEVAEKYRISMRTLDERIAKGEITAYRFGGRVLIDLDSVAALLKPIGGAA